MSHENTSSSRPTPPGSPSGPGTIPPYGAPTEPDQQPVVKHRPEMSLTQIVGGALAAMTAAALGSRLGVGGTIIGAAVASVIAAVASALYTASLRTTHDKVRTTLWAGQPRRGTKVSVQTTTGSPASATDAPASAVPDLPTAVSSPGPPTPTWTSDQDLTPVSRGRKPLPWKRIVGGSLAAFALAAATLTGVELLTGTALSGGDGTTISQVSNERANRSRPAPAESSASPSEQASDDSPSTEPSVEPSAEASPSASASASQSTEPSAEPSATPTEQTTTDPTTEPSAEPSATPSAGTGETGDSEGSQSTEGTTNGGTTSGGTTTGEAGTAAGATGDN